MAEEMQTQKSGGEGGGGGLRKGKVGHKKGSKGKKKPRVFKGTGEKVNIDGRMKKLFRKRARDYNSDNSDDDNAEEVGEEEPAPVMKYDEVDGAKSSGEEGEERGERNEFSDDEGGEVQIGITKFTEGCNAFRMAFKKITKTSVSDDVLGPVLSAHKKLVVEKLAEEEAERKTKGETKKEKHLLGEKGHVKPAANFLDAHDKFLIGVATKGVVKLFNAVNKAQNSQKGLNPSRFKDAKVIQKRRKEAFFSELGKPISSSAGASTKASTSTGQDDGEGPAWAPLRDNYMITSSRLKNWDKAPNDEKHVADDFGRPSYSSSDDD